MQFQTEFKEYLKSESLKRTLKKVFAAFAGVILLQSLLAYSYIKAFAKPEIKDIPLVVIPPQNQPDFKTKLNEGTKNIFKIEELGEQDAEKKLENREIVGIYSPNLNQSTLKLSTAAHVKESQITQTALQSFDAAFQTQTRKLLTQNPATAPAAQIPVLPLKIEDQKPLLDTDPNGTALFYTAFAAVFAGYLVAVALNLIRHKKEFDHVDAILRIISLIIFSLVSSTFLAFITTRGLKVLPEDSFLDVVLIGFIGTFAVSLLATSLISIAGVVGTGLVIILFVILGTPASGGPLPVEFTGNGVWKDMANLLPTGILRKALVDTSYYDAPVFKDMSTLLVYILIGIFTLLGIGAKNTSSSGLDKEE